MSEPTAAPASSVTAPSDRPSRGRVLVTGASVAGPAAAYWLERVGYDVTVLERSAEPRLGGQNVDVRGLAREVLERMGLREAVLAANTGEVGTRFVTSGVGRSRSSPQRRASPTDPPPELEVLRASWRGSSPGRAATASPGGPATTWWRSSRAPRR